MSVQRSLGQAANQRGEANEERVLCALNEVKEDSAWMIGARRATHEEDARGVDIVVETSDRGPLFVQVKSSKAGVRTFQRRKGRRADFIAVVLVKSGDDPATIRRKTLHALQELRERLRPNG